MPGFRPLSVSYARLLAFAPSASSSWGECVFEAVLNAQVVDVNGDALADVLVRTCQGERCAVAEADDNCVSTITDSDGRFSFEIPQCRLE
ncbi:MAG TPA: carboxypeptidase regulatory-like domain-containing protein, partial [Nannocystis exedens]|nr:carboxypeptidase regulatory-like domain-containing protein [Nannocystis exedens]